MDTLSRFSSKTIENIPSTQQLGAHTKVEGKAKNSQKVADRLMQRI